MKFFLFPLVAAFVSIEGPGELSYPIPPEAQCTAEELAVYDRLGYDSFECHADKEHFGDVSNAETEEEYRAEFEEFVNARE